MKTNAIDKLDTHHEAMLIKTVFEGATTGELAHEFGLSESYIGQLKASECWKLKLQELQTELKEEHLNALHQLRGSAIKTYKASQLESQDISIRLKGAKDILDRTGFNAGVDLKIQGTQVINLFRPAYLLDSEDVEEAEVVETKELEE